MRSEWLKFGPEESGDVDPLLPRLEQLWSESGTIWDENESHEDFKMFVAADYRLVYRTLLRYRDRINTFLEWGAWNRRGLTIMAQPAWAWTLLRHRD